MWTNFHTHSLFCDGVGHPSEYVAQAVASGVVSLGFSSHAPLPFDKPWCMKKENMNSYLSTVAALKADHSAVQVYCGLEADYIPGVVSPADFKPLLDYTIGSVHFVDTFADGTHWEIDNTLTVFSDGLREIFHNDVRAAITRYFELTREMIEVAHPDIAGHIDKIKMHNTGGRYFNESDTWYRDAVARTLDAIAGAGTIVEVNTRGLYQKKSPTTYPSPWILEMMRQRNIPITINSDAHHPKDIISEFKNTAALLIAIGFQKISILKDGCWQPVTLTVHGIT